MGRAAARAVAACRSANLCAFTYVVIAVSLAASVTLFVTQVRGLPAACPLPARCLPRSACCLPAPCPLPGGQPGTAFPGAGDCTLQAAAAGRHSDSWQRQGWWAASLVRCMGSTHRAPPPPDAAAPAPPAARPPQCFPRRAARCCAALELWLSALLAVVWAAAAAVATAYGVGADGASPPLPRHSARTAVWAMGWVEVALWT